jgi:hypothetical protein
MNVDNNDIIDDFVSNKMLVNIDATDATNVVGEEGDTLFVDAK